MLFAFVRNRMVATRLARADAAQLILQSGERAYEEARRRERTCILGWREVHNPSGRAHWRKVARVIKAQSHA